jgi:hypothetical protein
MHHLRRTSSYLVLIETPNPNETLDELVARNKALVPIETTAVYDGVAGLRFRCMTDDRVAFEIAAEIANGQPFKVRTGYGVNQREVTL